MSSIYLPIASFLDAGILSNDSKCHASIRGKPIDFDQLQTMRVNMTSYVNYVNHFAPCIVSVQTWKDLKATKGRMAMGIDTLDEFFTVSDEAFMIVVLLNYEERWTAEYEMLKKQKVN